MKNRKIQEGFETEEDLVKVILSSIRTLKTRSFKIELELDAGVGFADIILYKRNPRTTQQLNILAKIPPRLASLLHPSNSENIFNINDFANFLGLSTSSAQRISRQFQQLGLWNSNPKNTLLPVIKTQPFHQIISIEAKLSDWSRALVQAYRNLQFADESWVVLDHRFYKPALTQLERFRRSGVGLASVDIEGRLFIHYEAPTSSPISITKRWHAQAALARRALRYQ